MQAEGSEGIQCETLKGPGSRLFMVAHVPWRDGKATKCFEFFAAYILLL